MSLKTGIWAQAFLRRCNAEGLYGAVVKKGAEEAGALFIIIDRRDGTFHLFGPAPGPAYDRTGDRRFIEELPYPAARVDVDGLLARRRKFDSDLWIIEVEDRQGTAGLKASE
jgi:hypothetical protein